MAPDRAIGICRFCHAMCPLEVQFDGARIVKLIGDKNNPVYHGYSCVKGRNYHSFHTTDDRILQPLKRAPDGTRTPLPMSQALDEIGAKLQAIIAQHGSRSVAMYTGTFSHFCVAGVMTRAAFMDAIGSPMRFSNATIDQPGKPIAMALHGRWGGGPQAFAESDVCMVVGANPLVSMWGGIPAFNPAHRLHEAKKRGLKLIVIDPRLTETARHADIHLQCLPGHDPEILAAIINVIIREQRYDAEFVRDETQGFDALQRAVAPFTPERVAGPAGLQAQDIVAAAHLFADGRAGNATGGTGSNMAPYGTLMEYLLLALNSLCGRWVKAGEQVPNLGVLFRMYSGVARAEKPRPAFGFGETLRVRGLADTAAGLPTPALADEILTPGEGQVRALIVVGGNPLVAFPNRAKVQRALEQLDLLVVVDPQLSATAELADYVIGPMFGFEQPAISFANEGMVVYGLSIGFQEPFALYQPTLVAPPDGSDVIEDWRVFYELARRMDLTLAVRGRAYDMDNAPTTDTLIAEFLKSSPVPFDEVKQHPEGQLFPHRSAPAEPRDVDWPHRLQLGHPEMMRELDAVATARHDSLAAGDSAADVLELLLVSRREHGIYNSVAHRLPALARKMPYNPAHMNPGDAARLGLSDGDRIEIANAIGCVEGIVHLAADVREGVLSVAHNFPNQVDPPAFCGTSAAALIDDAGECDRLSGLPRMSAVPVRVSAMR